MQKKRLLKLADLLDADAKDKTGIKFNYGSWGYMCDLKNPVSCGTEACAMGLAAISGAFRRSGLDYNRKANSVSFMWKGREVDGIAAAERLFEIDHGDAWDLFVPSVDVPMEGAKAERALAKRIRNFVKRAA